MQISRRTALTTTAAAITTGAIAAPLAIKSAATKAALVGDPVVALVQQLHAANEAWWAAEDAYEEAGHRVGFNICYDNGLVDVKSSDGPCHWGAGEIREAAEVGRHRHRITPEQRDAALAEIERRQLEAHKVRRELGIESLHQDLEHWKAQFWDLRARLLDTPAATVDGVLAKLRGFYRDDEIAQIMAGDYPSDDLPKEFAASIYHDLARLAGGVTL